MHYDLDRRLADDELADLEDAVLRHAGASAPVTRLRRDDERVEAMTCWPARAQSRYDADEVREAVDFLAWLLRGNFVLLGAREYEISQDGERSSRAPGSASWPTRSAPRTRGRPLS